MLFYRSMLLFLLFLITASVMTIDYNVARLARSNDHIADRAATSLHDDIFGGTGMITFADHRGSTILVILIFSAIATITTLISKRSG